MSVEEILQLMRTCNVAQVRAELEWLKIYNTVLYKEVAAFYTLAARQPK